MQLEWVDVVDMDIVEIGNLGYQLLFDKDDVGKYKADVTLFKLFGPNYKERHTAHLCRVQEVPRDVLLSYDILLGCFDNLEARFYVNQLVMSNSTSNTTPIRPLYIDGGSMGLGGQAQLIIPTVSLLLILNCRLLPAFTVYRHSSPMHPQRCTLSVLLFRTQPFQSTALRLFNKLYGHNNVLTFHSIRKTMHISDGLQSRQKNEQ